MESAEFIGGRDLHMRDWDCVTIYFQPWLNLDHDTILKTIYTIVFGRLGRKSTLLKQFGLMTMAVDVQVYYPCQFGLATMAYKHVHSLLCYKWDPCWIALASSSRILTLSSYNFYLDITKQPTLPIVNMLPKQDNSHIVESWLTVVILLAFQVLA
jgi:hypothetical protein